MSTKGKSAKLEYHGMITTADNITKWCNHLLDSNERIINQKRGKKTAGCIWGTHGIGKTDIPEQVAASRGIGFVKITPAEFSEMGDMLGMPMTGCYVIKDGQSKLIEKDLLEAYELQGWSKDIIKPSMTMNSAPDWVPKIELGAPEKGIFLIDDANRADKTLLNGCMNLLQNGGLSSWQLPIGWTIILTCNPSGANYSIKELDAAQRTRMTHISMKFDANVWAKWAVNNYVDDRIINFVLKYPEMISDGEMTTPRTLSMLSNLIYDIGDLKANIHDVQMHSRGTIDENAANSFTSFINDNLTTLLSPETILNSKKFDEQVEKGMMDSFTKCKPQRVDVISILATRMVLYCTEVLDGKLTKEQTENLKKFINIKDLPNDTRLQMAQDLVKCSGLKSIMADPEIGKLLLKKM